MNGTNGITYRWVVGLTIAALGVVFSIVLALGAYTFTTAIGALQDRNQAVEARIKALEDRQLPSAERMVNMEGTIKTIDVKVDNLSTEVNKLSTQIQLDRQARQSSGGSR